MAAKPQPVHVRGRLMVPTDSFSFEYQGAPHTLVPGDVNSIVEDGHPIMEGKEHLFRPLIPRYKVDENLERWETATAAPGEVRGA